MDDGGGVGTVAMVIAGLIGAVVLFLGGRKSAAGKERKKHATEAVDRVRVNEAERLAATQRAQDIIDRHETKTVEYLLAKKLLERQRPKGTEPTHLDIIEEVRRQRSGQRE